MILEDETYEAFGYEVWELKSQSNKPILAACDDCGKVRTASKANYHALCRSCARKGNAINLGRKHTEEQNAQHSAAMRGKYVGENNPNFKGGLSVIDPKEYTRLYNKKYLKTPNGKIKDKRNKAKRKRELGYILILPVEAGEHGHHFTDKYVIGIPKDVHLMLSGYSRKKHRTLVLQWLKANDKRKYNLVLCVLAKESLE